MNNKGKMGKILRGFIPPQEFETCIGVVIKAPPELTIQLKGSRFTLFPDMLYMNDRLFNDYTRTYKLTGTLDKITINATSSNKPCGAGYTNQHGTIQGNGSYEANGTFINTDTLKVGDLVKVTPVVRGQMWIVDYKIRKIKEKKK